MKTVIPTRPRGGRNTSASPAPAKPGRLRNRLPSFPKLLPYLILLPALIAELAVHIIPMLFGVWMSFIGLTQFLIRNWTRAPFVGLENYFVSADLNSPVGASLLHSLGITIAFSLISVTLSWLIGLAAAVALQRPFRGRGTLRTLFLVPFALPIFTSVITWEFMFQRDTGMVNALLVNELHLFHTRPFWLTGANSFITLVVTSVWRTWPFAFLTITAGLQSVPTELYEAAAVDGANPWRRLREVTLPMLRPVNHVLILVLFLWTFNDFNLPYILFGQSPPPAADLIPLHVYNASFNTWNFGLGSAMSVLMLLFLLIVTIAYRRINRGRSNAV